MAIKTYKGIKNPRFRRIIRNRDEKGRILTYTAFNEAGIPIEVNSLKVARIISLRI